MVQRFIIVDDDATNNMLCKYTIKKAAPQSDVQAFEFPATALRYISSAYNNTIDQTKTILFLDINMPEIDGWDFLEEFSKMNDHIQEQFIIYLLSSSIDPSDKQRAASNNFVKDFLSKPLTYADVSKLASQNI
ncbi:MAG: response regulator [Parafilimonas sp.]|nr:response regulator [Parafilimonas sp.]